uniref:Bicaudal D-related protein 1 n=1 Tax=Aceria tosichella TaxID=561515 RepID=A0A6G1S7G3_9ACAR
MNEIVEDARGSQGQKKPEEPDRRSREGRTQRMAKGGDTTMVSATATTTTATIEPASDSMASVNRRSRSRGRTPSELLARKQQLLQSNQGRAAGLEESETQEPISGGEQSAEAKLESLSVILRNHQVSSSLDEMAAATEENDEDATGQLGNVSSSKSATRLANGNHQQTQDSQQQQLKSVDDVYILLAKKEKDLQLAAELGKVLLERNEDLSRANERIAEEYSHKLELLEQEKHKLKRKLDQLDGEYENRLIELQTDCNILKNKLEQQQQASKQAEKEKSKLIEDLVQQNQRLTSELTEATKSEELLASQLEQVNERLSSRLSNRSNHVAQVDALQEEIQILNQRKQDLERRLKLAQSEKSNLNSTIDELGDKVLVFENLLNEKDLRIGELAIEINELRDSSSWLSARLESMISLNERLVDCVGADTGEHGTANNDGSGQVHNLDDLRTISERDRSQLVEQLKELRLKKSSRIKANEMILFEADERRRKSALLNTKLAHGGARRRRHTRQTMSSPTKLDDDDNNDGRHSSSDLMSDNDELDESQRSAAGLNAASDNLSDMISEIYFILNGFLLALQQRKESLQLSTGGQSGSASSVTATANGHHNHPNEDSGIGSTDELGHHRSGRSTSGDKSIASSSAGSGSADAAQLATLNDLGQWRKLINQVRQLIEEMPCSSCQLMISERTDYEQLQKVHAKVCEELRLKNGELMKLNAQNIEQAAQLSVLEDKCKLLSDDLENCDRPKEEIVRLAWKTRDEAVSRKNNAEIQLAKTRIENMQISSQLMEVVQQKGELSQKLAQFEDDIHYMMQRSVRQRFSWEEYAEETRRLGSKSRYLNGNGSTTNQLINLVPSLAASGNNAQGSSSFQQLLSLTGVNLLTPTKNKSPVADDSDSNANTNGSMSTSQHDEGSLQQHARQAATTNLLTSLKSGTNRLNLKFWQKSS